MSDNTSDAGALLLFGMAAILVLAFIAAIFTIPSSTPKSTTQEIAPAPKSTTQEIAPINNPIPEVYEVKTDTTYYYAVWIMPNGEKTVYICHQGGVNTGAGAVFEMAQAVHPDGTPVTPEELGIVVSQDTDKENQSP